MPHVATVYGWLQRHAGFCDSYVLAREQQAHTIADRAVAMALDGDRVITDPQVAKVQLDASSGRPLGWHPRSTVTRPTSRSAATRISPRPRSSGGSVDRHHGHRRHD